MSSFIEVAFLVRNNDIISHRIHVYYWLLLYIYLDFVDLYGRRRWTYHTLTLWYFTINCPDVEFTPSFCPKWPWLLLQYLAYNASMDQDHLLLNSSSTAELFFFCSAGSTCLSYLLYVHDMKCYTDIYIYINTCFGLNVLSFLIYSSHFFVVFLPCWPSQEVPGMSLCFFLVTCSIFMWYRTIMTSIDSADSLLL